MSLQATNLTRARSALTRLGPPGDTHDDDPKGEIRFGAVIAGLFFVILLGWAAFARLDAAAYASGQVSVEGHRQSVQHKDGGIVSAINVREGQKVKAGDVLVELNGAEAKAVESSLAAQVLGLQAQRARLQAEQLGAASITWPAAFASLTGDDQVEAQRAMKVQLVQFQARVASMAAQKAVLRQRAAELGQQAEGFQRQIQAADSQQKLLGDELAGTQALADKGYAPLNRVRALQRAQAELGGARGQYAAQVAQSQQQAGEAQMQMLQLDRQRGEDIASQLRDIDFQLNDLTPKLNAARDQLARIQVRAPASGAVVGLSVFTVGGVVTPGQKLMDIVPDNVGMVIEARISPNDADDLRVGQTTEVKFTSIRDRGLPILAGRLTKLSADSFTDDRTGARYYMAEVTVPPDQMAALMKVKGPGFALRAGMPAQVLVPLRKRTALQYLLEPLTDAIWSSFHEH